MDSYRELFKTIEILPLYFQYILSVYIISILMYMVHNIHLFTKNLEVHNHNTRSVNNFYLPITNLTKYQKAAYCTGIEIFNYLPTDIKNVANEIQVFKKTLKRFLLDNSIYSIDKYFNVSK